MNTIRRESRLGKLGIDAKEKSQCKEDKAGVALWVMRGAKEYKYAYACVCVHVRVVPSNR